MRRGTGVLVHSELTEYHDCACCSTVLDHSSPLDAVTFRLAAALLVAPVHVRLHRHLVTCHLGKVSLGHV
jgi:hypothetical protein